MYIVKNFHRIDGTLSDGYFDSTGNLLPSKPEGELDEISLGDLRRLREGRTVSVIPTLPAKPAASAPAPVKKPGLSKTQQKRQDWLATHQQQDEKTYHIPSLFSKGKN